MKPLVIYYSYRGNTKSIVDMIQKKIDADVLRIETVVPYSTNYNQVVNQGQDEVNRGYCPKLKPVDINLDQNIKFDSNILNLTEFRWNPFESTIYGTYDGTVYIDSDYYLIGTDDQGNKICYQETGRNGQETMFRQTICLYPGYEEISPEANTITLQLYEVKNDTAHQVSEEILLFHANRNLSGKRNC